MTDALTADRNKGVRARALLDDPLLTEAFDTLRSTYMDAWQKTQVAETEKRERLWVMHKLVDRVKGHLEQLVDNGKLAEAELTEFERKKRFRVF